MNPACFRYPRRRPGTGGFVRGPAVAAGLAVFTLFLSFTPGTARADPAAEERKLLLRQQRERYEAGVALDPPLDDKTHKVADIFRLKLQDSRLVLAPDIPATAMHLTRRVQLEGVPSPATVVFVASLGRRPGMGHSRFDFSSERFDEESGVYTRVRVLTYSFRNLRLTQSYRALDAQRDVSLEETGEEVRLNVSGTGIDGVNLSEPDFTALRRRHPRETERWLRPMLLELGQERLLAPDPAAAWQVLADDWPEDPAAREAVLRALPDLGAGDYHAREAAARKIADLGLAGATTVLRLDKQGLRSDLSAEQNRELDAVVSLRRVLSAEEAVALHDDPEFLLDCLSCEDVTAREVALRRLQKLNEAAAAFDHRELSGDADRRAIAVAGLREKVLGPATRPSQ